MTQLEAILAASLLRKLSPETNAKVFDTEQIKRLCTVIAEELRQCAQVRLIDAELRREGTDIPTVEDAVTMLESLVDAACYHVPGAEDVLRRFIAHAHTPTDEIADRLVKLAECFEGRNDGGTPAAKEGQGEEHRPKDEIACDGRSRAADSGEKDGGK